MVGPATACRCGFPQGAPLLVGYEIFLEDGCAAYHLPKAEHRECRIFVQQAESAGTMYCKERTTEQLEIVRRLEIGGLKNATVHIYPDKKIKLNVYLNADRPWLQGKVAVEAAPEFGHCFRVRNATGKVVVSW